MPASRKPSARKRSSRAPTRKSAPRKPPIRRRHVVSGDAEPAERIPAVAATQAVTDRAAVVERMWKTAQAQVEAIEKRLGESEQNASDAERDARSLAVLSRTLRELTAVDAADRDEIPDEHDEPVPRDIEELRRSLARKLDALVAEQQASLPPDP